MLANEGEIGYHRGKYINICEDLNMYQTILFDLDGTLTDPGIGITNSAMYALEKLGYEVPAREELYKFIGPPLYDSFREFYDMSPEQTNEAVRLFREYFAEHGIHENELYDGIIEMLRQLKDGGKRLVLATSKPEKWANVVMHQFGLDVYVPEIAGASMGTERSKKGQVIAYALEQFGIDPATAVMVGDRKHDILGGRENNLPGIGVTYGYGDREELESAGAVAVVDTPEQLTTLLLRGLL